MKRHLIVAGVSALCMALAPTMAFGTESPPPPSTVTQTNSAPADATAGNANTSGQLIGQSGGGSQSAGQTAVNTQVIPIAAAPATTVQTLPVNLNLPVRIASPGDNGDVRQSNTAPATAEATNVNTSRQLIEQSGRRRRQQEGRRLRPERPPDGHQHPGGADRGRPGDLGPDAADQRQRADPDPLARRRRRGQAVEQGARGRGREQRQRLPPGDLAGVREEGQRLDRRRRLAVGPPEGHQHAAAADRARSGDLAADAAGQRQRADPVPRRAAAAAR